MHESTLKLDPQGHVCHVSDLRYVSWKVSNAWLLARRASTEQKFLADFGAAFKTDTLFHKSSHDSEKLLNTLKNS